MWAACTILWYFRVFGEAGWHGYLSSLLAGDFLCGVNVFLLSSADAAQPNIHAREWWMIESVVASPPFWRWVHPGQASSATQARATSDHQSTKHAYCGKKTANSKGAQIQKKNMQNPHHRGIKPLSLCKTAMHQNAAVSNSAFTEKMKKCFVSLDLICIFFIWWTGTLIMVSSLVRHRLVDFQLCHSCRNTK